MNFFDAIFFMARFGISCKVVNGRVKVFIGYFLCHRWIYLILMYIFWIVTFFTMTKKQNIDLLFIFNRENSKYYFFLNLYQYVCNIWNNLGIELVLLLHWWRKIQKEGLMLLFSSHSNNCDAFFLSILLSSVGFVVRARIFFILSGCNLSIATYASYKIFCISSGPSQ